MARSSGEEAVRLELTERQREVLRLVAAGKTNAEIGDALDISLDGAKWHVSEILAKLGVSTREEAAAWWQTQNGIRPRIARALRSIIPASLWLRIGLGVAVAGGAAAVALGVTVLGDSGQKGASSATRQVTGTIKSYSEATFSGPGIESSPGVVVLTDGTSFQVDRHTGMGLPQQPIAFSDLKIGDVVTVTARLGSDASLVAAQRIDLFMEPLGSAAVSGPAAGQSHLPNGALQVLGSVIARDATTVQLVYPGGVSTVSCGPSCMVTKIISDRTPDLKAGDRITATVTNGVADAIRFDP